MSNKNDVVIIELDRPRELRFGHKALKTMVALTGKEIDATNPGSSIDFDEIEKVMYCGLLSDARNNNENLKLEDMEDLLDKAPKYVDIVNKLQEAINIAFGNFGDEKNSQGIVALPGKPANGIGKNP